MGGVIRNQGMGIAILTRMDGLGYFHQMVICPKFIKGLYPSDFYNKNRKKLRYTNENSMKLAFMFLIFELSLVSYVQAQDLFVYPAQGQSNDQMEKDKFECYNWAKGQTGFDPMQMPTASSPPPSQDKEKRGRQHTRQVAC